MGSTNEEESAVAHEYYRNVITVEILSTEPWTSAHLDDLSMVHEAITDGDSSGAVTVTVHNEQVTPAVMADLLTAQGSAPDFLLGQYDLDDLPQH